MVMNMKLPILFLCLMSVIAPAFADDVKLIERKSCEQIKTEIADLSAIANPTDAEKAELVQLKLLQRSSCTAKSGGRRTISRGQPVATTSVEAAPAVKSDALKEYLDAKKSNCDKLNTEIEKLTADPTDSSKATTLAEMQKYYDADCVAPKEVVAEKIAEVVTPSAPAKTDEEIEAEFNANLAAGLCGDGTKPNRFGCCTDEVFRDMGNTVFACCPKSGGDLCFPPIQK